MKSLLQVLVCLLMSATAFGGITMNVSGVSGAIPETQDQAGQYFYSNITYNTDASGKFFVGDPGGATCSLALNPNCKTASDLLTIQASLDRVNREGRLYLVHADPGPNTGTAIQALGLPVPYGPVLRNAQIAVSFGALCSALGLDELGPNCQDKRERPMPIKVNFALIADNNNNGVFDAGDDIVNFTLTFASSIPRFAMPMQGGVYDFTAASGDGAVHMKNIMADLDFPNVENAGVGVKAVRFYYAKIQDTNYNQDVFKSIDPLFKNSRYLETTVDGEGNLDNVYFTGLENGAAYYFRAAVVDNAGNIGYLTVNDSATRMAVPRPKGPARANY